MGIRFFRAQSTIECLLIIAAIIGAVMLAVPVFSSKMASNYEKMAGELDNVGP